MMSTTFDSESCPMWRLYVDVGVDLNCRCRQCCQHRLQSDFDLLCQTEIELRSLMGHVAFDRIFGDYTVDNYMVSQASFLAELAPEGYYFDSVQFLEDITMDGCPNHLSSYFHEAIISDDVLDRITELDLAYHRDDHPASFEPRVQRGYRMMFDDYDSLSDDEEMPSLQEVVEHIAEALDALDQLFDNPQNPPAF